MRACLQKYAKREGVECAFCAFPGAFQTHMKLRLGVLGALDRTLCLLLGHHERIEMTCGVGRCNTARSRLRAESASLYLIECRAHLHHQGELSTQFELTLFILEALSYTICWRPDGTKCATDSRMEN